MDDKRSLEHYRDHELVCKIHSGVRGWSYKIHVLAHEGDRDRVLCEESSAGYYPTDIEALQAAHSRCRLVVDDLLETA